MIVSESCHDCVRVPYAVKTYGERQKTQPPDADHRGDHPELVEPVPGGRSRKRQEKPKLKKQGRQRKMTQTIRALLFKYSKPIVLETAKNAMALVARTAVSD